MALSVDQVMLRPAATCDVAWASGALVSHAIYRGERSYEYSVINEVAVTRMGALVCIVQPPPSRIVSGTIGEARAAIGD